MIKLGELEFKAEDFEVFVPRFDNDTYVHGYQSNCNVGYQIAKSMAELANCLLAERLEKVLKDGLQCMYTSKD